MTKILIVRRDNIGDLICTLPLIESIRKLNKRARVDLLVNSYCAPVVDHNPDINHVYVYTKAKHRSVGESLFGVYARRLLLTLKLRALNYDWLVLANVGYSPRPIRWARQIKAKRTIGFVNTREDNRNGVLTDPILLEQGTVRHEVEYLMQLLQPFGKASGTPASRIVPDPVALSAARHALSALDDDRLLIGINLSARLPSQQWPAERFAELIHQAKNEFRFVLFWSPGSEYNSGHPGDDEKALRVINACRGSDLIPYSTRNLSDLIAGVTCVDMLVTSDGGALHIGAACNKPIVALFGGSNSRQWYPWRVPHIILHPESRDVNGISVREVFDAIVQLREAAL